MSYEVSDKPEKTASDLMQEQGMVPKGYEEWVQSQHGMIADANVPPPIVEPTEPELLEAVESQDATSEGASTEPVVIEPVEVFEEPEPEPIEAAEAEDVIQPPVLVGPTSEELNRQIEETMAAFPSLENEFATASLASISNPTDKAAAKKSKSALIARDEASLKNSLDWPEGTAGAA